MTSPKGPSSLTQQTAAKTDSPSDLRVGIVSAVTARGIEVQVANGPIEAAHLDSYAPAVGDSVALMKTQDSWLCMGRVVGSGTVTDYSAPGSAAGPSVLDAIRTTGTSNLAVSSGGTVAVPKYTLTYYHPPNHQVLILMFFTWFGSVVGDWLLFDITETTSGTAVGEFTEPAVAAAVGRGSTISALVKESLGGTRRSISCTMSRFIGTGAITITQNDSRPGYMIALDMGDASVFRAV